MKRCLIAMLVIAVMLALSVAVHAQETDPAAVLRAELDAMIAGDYETAWTFFADDAVFTNVTPWGTETYTGKEEIRAWVEGLISEQGWKMHEAEILKVEGDTVTTRMRNSIESVRALGLPWVEATEVEVVRDGKIVSATWTMSEESAAALQAAIARAPVRRLFEEVWMQGNLDVVDELFASDAVVHIPPDPKALSQADYKQLVVETRTGFPDSQFVLEDIVAQGEEVGVRWTASGTHTGEYFGIAPTGKQVKYPAIEIFHLAGEQIQESWSHVDFLPLYNQLGVDAPPFAAKAADATRFPTPAAPAETDELGVMLHRLMEEVWEGDDLDVVDEIMAPDYTEENSWQPLFGLPPIQSAEDYKQFVAGSREVNPDLNNRMEDIIAEGDTVVTRYTLRGTGPVDYTVAAVDYFADGKLKQRWQVADTLTLFRQLGMIPPPTLPITGGDGFPGPAWVVVLGWLAIVGGLGLALLHRRSYRPR